MSAVEPPPSDTGQARDAIASAARIQRFLDASEGSDFLNRESYAGVTTDERIELRRDDIATVVRALLGADTTPGGDR